MTPAATGSSAPASTIKVLLAITVLDQLDRRAAVRAAPAHTEVECSCVGMVPGQVSTARQLLDALLTVSGNDAANRLGDMLGGYRAAITRMNAKAQSLGGKTGYTNLAGDTFVTTAQRGGRHLVVCRCKATANSTTKPPPCSTGDSPSRLSLSASG